MAACTKRREIAHVVVATVRDGNDVMGVQFSILSPTMLAGVVIALVDAPTP